jgi:hypothetical protein
LRTSSSSSEKFTHKENIKKLRTDETHEETKESVVVMVVKKKMMSKIEEHE